MAGETREAVREFALWTPDRLDASCGTAYERYARELRELHRPWLTSPGVERADVFPAGLEWLADAIGRTAWDEYWWATKSSQTLALTLLGAALRSDDALKWLPHAAGLGESRLGLFEVALAEHVLRERPRQTQLDFVAVGRRGLVAAEAKFTERGLGACSCRLRARGACSPRVLERPYWYAAARDLGLKRTGGGCALSIAYQAVRNLAAADAIAGPTRSAAFVLLYDARNPYFGGSDSWPGWARVLSALATGKRVAFGALSWQRLLAAAPLDPRFLSWASSRHGLEPEREPRDGGRPGAR